MGASFVKILLFSLHFLKSLQSHKIEMGVLLLFINVPFHWRHVFVNGVTLESKRMGAGCQGNRPG